MAEEITMTENNMLFKSKVCFDDYYETKDPKLIYDCWIDANSNGWNGWAMPYMERDEFYRFVKTCINNWMENPNMDDGSDGNFIDEIMAIKPQEINGKTLYFFGGWLTWDIEDDDFIEKRNKLLEEK
jgi:hypothetical protein